MGQICPLNRLRRLIALGGAERAGCEWVGFQWSHPSWTEQQGPPEVDGCAGHTLYKLKAVIYAIVFASGTLRIVQRATRHNCLWRPSGISFAWFSAGPQEAEREDGWEEEEKVRGGGRRGRFG